MTLLVPTREEERLSALRNLRVIDTEPESSFDAICNYARTFFQVSIAYIAFIDEGRQWLKAACGMKLVHVPRIGTFCARTILLDRVLVVENASLDPRFARNAYVIGEPHICFYAGAPLTLAEGIHVGTLCLIDTVPKKFSAEDATALRDLAKFVVDCLQVRARQMAKGQLGTAHFEVPAEFVRRNRAKPPVKLQTGVADSRRNL